MHCYLYYSHCPKHWGHCPERPERSGQMLPVWSPSYKWTKNYNALLFILFSLSRVFRTLSRASRVLRQVIPSVLSTQDRCYLFEVQVTNEEEKITMHCYLYYSHCPERPECSGQSIPSIPSTRDSLSRVPQALWTVCPSVPSIPSTRDSLSHASRAQIFVFLLPTASQCKKVQRTSITQNSGQVSPPPPTCITTPYTFPMCQ